MKTPDPGHNSCFPSPSSKLDEVVEFGLLTALAVSVFVCLATVCSGGIVYNKKG
jgi:hypothetical protein